MNAFALKLVAVIAMAIDHIGAAVMWHTRLIVAHPHVYSLSRYIGRIAFPIFAYFIANGCRHTKNIDKYLLRLGILALLSEIPFDLAFWGGDINFLRNTNIFYTLFLGVLAIAVYECVKLKRQQWLLLMPLILVPATLLINFTPWDRHGYLVAGIVTGCYAVLAFCLAKFLPKIEAGKEIGLKRKIIPILSMLPFLALAEILGTDYGNIGVGLIIALYLSNPANKLTRALVMIAGMVALYGGGIRQTHWIGQYYDVENWVQIHTISQQGVLIFAFAMIAVVLIYAYNGKPGTQSQAAKWAFYAFYPAHIVILLAVRLLVGM